MDSAAARQLVLTGEVRRSGPRVTKPRRQCVKLGRLYVLIPEGVPVPATPDQARDLALTSISTDLCPANWDVVATFPEPGTPSRALRVQHAGRVEWLLIPDGADYRAGLTLRELADIGCRRCGYLPHGTQEVGSMNLDSGVDRAAAAARNVAQALASGRRAYLPGAMPG